MTRLALTGEVGEHVSDRPVGQRRGATEVVVAEAGDRVEQPPVSCGRAVDVTADRHGIDGGCRVGGHV